MTKPITTKSNRKAYNCIMMVDGKPSRTISAATPAALGTAIGNYIAAQPTVKTVTTDIMFRMEGPISRRVDEFKD